MADGKGDKMTKSCCGNIRYDRTKLFQEIIPSRATLLRLEELSKKAAKNRCHSMILKNENISSMSDLKDKLYQDFMSVRGSLDGNMALLFQEETGSEMSFDLIFNKTCRRNFLLITRGGPGMAMSDHFYFFIFSPNYVVFPIFHTHLQSENELGVNMPSLADLRALNNLKILQGNDRIQSTVLFPDGKAVVYSIKNDTVSLFETRLDELSFGRALH